MILEAKNLSKTFHFPKETPLFSNISLVLKKGESIAITGRSGSGKTTLLHILGTLEKPDSGEVLIANTPFSKENSHKLRNKHIGFVFQSFNLLEDFTALENVLMPAQIARIPISKEHGMHLLNQVGLIDRANFPAKLLSGGEKQRVAIARALCNNPDVIFADEPSGNLDSANAHAIGELLLNLTEKKEKGLVLVTHERSLALACKKRYSLSEGNLKEII